MCFGNLPLRGIRVGEADGNLKFEIYNLKSSSNDKMFKNLNIENFDLNSNFKFQIKNYL